MIQRLGNAPVWMVLTPREVEAVKATNVRADDMRPAAILLRKVQDRLDARGELELSDDEVTACDRATKDWRNGFVKAFLAVCAAAGRH